MAEIENSVENLMDAFNKVNAPLEVMDATLEGHGPVKVVGKSDFFGFVPLAVLMTEDLYPKVLPPADTHRQETEEDKQVRTVMFDLLDAMDKRDGGDAA